MNLPVVEVVDTSAREALVAWLQLTKNLPYHKIIFSTLIKARIRQLTGRYNWAHSMGP